MTPDVTRPNLVGQTVALIPVRSLSSGKTRLGGTLDGIARSALIREMLSGVVSAALASGVIGRVIVISPDDEVLSFAGQLAPDLIALRQATGRPGLIAALDQGRAFAIDSDAEAMVILFGDLPLLSAEDVRTIAGSDAAVVISPDRHGEGTNALVLRFGPTMRSPADPFRFQFGEGSFRKHLAEADRMGLTAETVVTAGTSLDLDTPADLAEWTTRAVTPAAH